MPKRLLNIVWNLMTFLVLMTIAGTLFLIVQIFHDPTTPLNPFPPPTIPALIVLPTSTITETPTITGTSTPTLPPTSNPTSSSTATSAPSPTETPTPTHTVTPTPTGHMTLTALSNLSMYDIRTALAATLTVRAIRQIQTYAVESRYGPNPSFAVADNGAVSNQWATTIPQSFNWVKPREDMIGYYYYWGPDPFGINKKPVYDDHLLMNFETKGKGPKDGGVYFLRIRAIYPNGVENPEWSTAFIFKYDKSPPSIPELINADRAANGIWRKYSYAPTFTWSNATDNASGLSYYDLYWGPDPDSNTPTGSQRDTSFTPKLESGIFYLKIRTVDMAGNTSAWRRLFTLMVDNAPPETPDASTISIYPPYSTNSYPTSAPTINWKAANDAQSGVNFYELCWGNSPDNNTPNFTVVSPTFTPPPMTTAPGTSKTYFLRIRAVDFLGNASDWSNPYTIVYRPN